MPAVAQETGFWPDLANQQPSVATGSGGSLGSGNSSGELVDVPAHTPTTGRQSDASSDTCPAEAYVTLRDGVIFPVAVIELALALEARGITLEVTREAALVARPAARLTDADAGAIRHHKHALIALVRYIDQVSATYALTHALRRGKVAHASHR